MEVLIEFRCCYYLFFVQINWTLQKNWKLALTDNMQILHYIDEKKEGCCGDDKMQVTKASIYN